MSNVIDFNKYKKYTGTINKWDTDECTLCNQYVNKWDNYSDEWDNYSDEEKIILHIKQKSLITNYFDYVSKTRFYQQFDASINILSYPEWFRKSIKDGLYVLN